jgi:hypothetical protein
LIVEKSSLTQDAIQSSYYPSQPATISVGFRMGNHHPQPNLQLKITGMTEVTVYELGFEWGTTIIYPTYS